MATAPMQGPPPSPVFRIRVKDRTLDLSGDVSIKEKIAVRLATGLPFEAFLSTGEGKIGEDSLVVLWWLARRHNGEPNLAFDTSCAEWPSPLQAEDLDVTVIEGDDDDPEGSGPAS